MKSYVKQLSAHDAYRQQQGLRIQGSPTLATKFGELKSLTVQVRAFDRHGVAKTGKMKCQYNLEPAKSVLRFDCPNSECIGGDFDFTDILASAVDGRRTTVTSEPPCKGRGTAGGVNAIPCGNRMRYKLSLAYRPPRANTTQANVQPTAAVAAC